MFNHAVSAGVVSRRVTSIVLAGALAAFASLPPDLGAEDHEHRRRGRRPVSIQEVARRVQETLRTGRSTVTPPAELPRPDSPLTEPTAWSDLQRTLQDMDRWLADESRSSRSRAFTNMAAQSRRFAREALRDLMQVETDFLGSLRRLQQAARRLTVARSLTRRGSREDVWAIETLDDLASIGARLAADGLVRARNGGVDPARVARATQEGVELKEQGHYVAAFGHFEDGILAGAIPAFDLDRFEQHLIDAFELQSVGYQYTIARDGVRVRTSTCGETGLARTNADPPNTSQSGFKEVNLASVSKTITATVLVQLLEERHPSVDSPIAPWLPADWVLGPGIGPGADPQLSFRDLLNHVSGLAGNQNPAYTDADLKVYVEMGIVQSDKLVEKYQNANFALFRVAIPYLRYGENGVNQIAGLVPFAAFDEVIAGLYIETVREYAFDPTGFVEAGCVASDPIPTILYLFPSDGQSGRRLGDWTLTCGSGGWFMSSVELAGVMAFRRFSNLVMSPSARQLMDDNFLGWESPSTSWASGLYGVYRGHGGDLGAVDDPAAPGLNACYMEFFNGVQAALIVNSRGGGYSYQCTEMKKAFENAFIAP